MRLQPDSLRGRILMIAGLSGVVALGLVLLSGAGGGVAGAALVVFALVLGGGLWWLDRTLRDAVQRIARGVSDAQALRGGRIRGPLPNEFSTLTESLNRTLDARDRAEEKLLETAERHELILRATRDMIWDWDLQSDQIHRNEALRSFSGIERPSEPDRELWFRRIPEPDRTRVRRSLDEVIEGGGLFWNQEYPFKRADGVRARILDRGYVVRRDDGTPVRMVGVMTDVTDERRRTDEVRRARDRYESILRHAPFGVFLASSEGVILEWNPALVHILGDSWEGSIPQRKAPEFFVDPEEFRSLANDARQEGTVIGREALWKRADGEEIFVRLTASAFLERGRIALEVLAEDVTERRRLGEQVRQAQKMEAVGRLAGGVAHDFNNLLTVISGETRFLLSLDSGDEGTVLDEDMRESLEAIQEAGDRGGGLTRQLLAFSRRQVVKPVPLDLNEVVSQVERMLGRVLGEGVTLRTALSAELDPIVADPGELEQVLINLAVNARDAMPDGGVLEIGTANRRVTAKAAKGRAGLEPGDYVMMTVRDEGFGMDARTQARIFEPFFTTKPVGKGTGLGLSTVYGIIARGGGVIEVESEPGRGTTFRILLPVSTDEISPHTDTAPPLGEIPAGEGHVVVVEDEERVRRMAERILDRAGFHVTSYGDPREALDAVLASARPIDVLVTDVRMPGIDGDELAERIRMQRPDLPVLFVSGYPEEAVPQERTAGRGTDFLAKPFTPQQLLQRVQILLMHRSSR